MRFMICMGSMMIGKRSRLKSASAGKATEAVSGSPSAAKTPNAASEMRMGPAVNRIMLTACRKAAALTCFSSTTRRSLICFSYGSSHAYSLIALMPVMTSVTIFTRLSVSFTTLRRTWPIFFVTYVVAGMRPTVTAMPARVGQIPRMRMRRPISTMIWKGALQTVCRNCGSIHNFIVSLLCRLAMAPEPSLDLEARLRRVSLSNTRWMVQALTCMPMRKTMWKCAFCSSISIALDTNMAVARMSVIRQPPAPVSRLSSSASRSIGPANWNKHQMNFSTPAHANGRMYVAFSARPMWPLGQCSGSRVASKCDANAPNCTSERSLWLSGHRSSVSSVFLAPRKSSRLQ
mmetsp:Transcript_9986/g.25421  ORF Transcript_9986/g.25421 Transcript_9986/m.25421 type:complete len:346 (+) Transcript_9986:400-1437(+)